MKPIAALAAGLLIALAVSANARAHFQVILPSTDIVAEPSQAALTVDLVFTHPMEGGPAMDMAKPVRFGVSGPDGVEDLVPRLEAHPVDGKSAWRAPYTLAKPGTYILFVEPRPYWEPSEGKMIVHYAKVVVDGFGWGEGWDARIGFPVEIRPLVRPFGLWTGNVFRGIVERDGEPVPFAEVEVEWLNDGSVRPPSEPFVTQVIRADAGGAFSYAMPRAGWWGFAALLEDEERLPNPEGEAVPVEQGALIWVRAVDMD